MPRQTIAPRRNVFFAGESVTVMFSGVPEHVSGRAVFRTNLDGREIYYEEMIAEKKQGIPPAGLDWSDIELTRLAPGEFQVTLALPETGAFEGKCCFIPDDGSPLLWAEGENFSFKVEPAESAAGNTIYAAFVRQFGPNLYRSTSEEPHREEKLLNDASYTVVPPSGTFRQLLKELDHIFGELHCKILQLLPIHPLPVSYGRMGRYGSPFAATDYFAVEPSLAEFDPKATPMEQFMELVEGVHRRGGKLFLDIPVNHTGWGSKLQLEHPDYFVRKEDGTFENPGAWGVVWGDLCKLDYSKPEVSNLMAKVFLFWCHHGVDGFRCDAGYMVPESAWKAINARVRKEFPNTIFLLEGLGGPPETQRRLLKYAGLNVGYSELFQNYSRWEIEHYLPVMQRSFAEGGNLVSFAETHDNARLAAKGPMWAKLRFLVCGLLSTGGAFGFANGAEYLAAEKIDVHGAGGLSYGSTPNLCGLIGKINTLLGSHPAFTGHSSIELVTRGGGEVLAALRRDEKGGSRTLVLLNLDCEKTQKVSFPGELPPGGRDLLTGAVVSFCRSGNDWSMEIAPGEGMAVELEAVQLQDPVPFLQCRVMEQRAFLRRFGRCDERRTATGFADSPEQFVAELTNMNPPPLTVWETPRDARRIVPLPWNDLLLVKNDGPFRCAVSREVHPEGFISGIPLKDGSWGALLSLKSNNGTVRRMAELYVITHCGEKSVRYKGLICQLPRSANFRCRTEYSGRETVEQNFFAFGSNDSGSYALFPASWGPAQSKYDSLFAVNPNPRIPVDRIAFLSGLRLWVNNQGYSAEVNPAALEKFTVPGENRAIWRFRLPAGQGRRMTLEIEMIFAVSGNATRLVFTRPGGDANLPDSEEIALILRPDMEARGNHTVTRAFTGPESAFPAAVMPHKTGFTFTAGPLPLELRMDSGTFHKEPEWRYNCDLPFERRYGLQDKTDRFSPGYFRVKLGGKSSAVMEIFTDAPEKCRWPEECGLADPLVSALRRFVVKRDELATVIAGYPWFLDWGRDTLIVLRGLVRAPEFREKSAAILRAFAGFEKDGMLPNVLCGDHAANFDTSDAPLYLIVAVRDYIEATGDRSILEADCRGRKMAEVLDSILNHYQKGTPNGIRMDEESGLIFSPAHFTWMDTNYPAGTPREGYPAEIQALWYAALRFRGREELAAKVQFSIEKYFFRSMDGICSDSLHAPAGTPACAAHPDDHIRPNVLLFITMGAVKDPEHQRNILRQSAQLLIPGAIRTLADREVEYELPVSKDGWLLNDPRHPYRGSYSGPEDNSRKVAYHNGTAWCWCFPAYCEALCLCGGPAQFERACSLLSSGAAYFEWSAVGQLSEVADGDAPHEPGGCSAQAWSASEYLRVREFLKDYFSNPV